MVGAIEQADHAAHRPKLTEQGATVQIHPDTDRCQLIGVQEVKYREEYVLDEQDALVVARNAAPQMGGDAIVQKPGWQTSGRFPSYQYHAHFDVYKCT
ncbi:MAG TPA: hypothetical protein VLZ12_13015 [Verrucomicrobiae bacterium]|nr:hypothetical protein [Verrucomicrobiae bacterium]